MDRLFLDANVLFSAAYRPASLIRRIWELEGIEIWTSMYAADEARRNLREKRSAQCEDLERLLSKVRIHPAISSAAPIPREIEIAEKDRPVIAAAIEIKATHLLTGDKEHFAGYYGRAVGGVLVMPPVEYLRSRR